MISNISKTCCRGPRSVTKDPCKRHPSAHLPRSLSQSSNDVKVPIYTLGPAQRVTYTVQKDAHYDMSWYIWGKSIWPKLIAKAIQAAANDNKDNKDYPVKPDMQNSTPNAAFLMLYGSAKDFEISNLSDEDLAAQLAANVPQVASVKGNGGWASEE